MYLVLQRKYIYTSIPTKKSKIYNLGTNWLKNFMKFL